ncbi:MAG: hypothetical protein IIW03_05470 [Clostridia bacterium]|nr:hypothetical protein [Clostridia bacterium]
MKKSELLVQNQSLFAEVERRATEIEGLKIKIEELTEKAADIIKENDELKKALEELKAQNQELEQLNKQLHISALQGITLNNDAQTVEDDATEEAYEQQEVLEEVLEPEAVTEAVTEPESEPESEPEPEVLPEQPIDQFKKTEQPAFTPAPEELSLYGAEVIGRVTRVTASVLNKIEQIGGDAAASLNTLALGKNESIKFAVLSLAQSGREPNEIKAEMDRLANEAIIYLKSI